MLYFFQVKKCFMRLHCLWRKFLIQLELVILFAGGFIGYIAKTGNTSFENMKRAVIYGSAMASFCVEEFSIGKLKKLNARTINSRVKQFASLVNFDIKNK